MKTSLISIYLITQFYEKNTLVLAQEGYHALAGMCYQQIGLQLVDHYLHIISLASRQVPIKE